MILKSLIVQGFKSFPDRTEIRFASGMTAIVGPNGSGKSNISDAIRWVLGEQSTRSLRGVKMEDVIFSGTQKRRPVGFAEVSLILDNTSHVFRSDYTEIMVTRRYYRSGESEYALNKKPCRLKDIHELFMDTGLGRDGYSMIGQGRIDEILSLKSEDRREIFEEAAGVTKFRYRKEEAGRKLEATEENLVRIRDLYRELESQAGPLAQQAEKARSYLLLRDQLKTLEVSLWLMRLSAIQNEVNQNEDDLKVCNDQLQAARTTQSQLYQQSEALTQELHQADAKADDLRRQIRIIEQNRAELSSRCAVLEANLKNNAENIVRAREGHTKQTARVQELEAQIAAHQQRQAMLDTVYEGLCRAMAVHELQQVQAQEQAQQISDRQAQLKQQRTQAEQTRFAAELDRTAGQTGLDGMSGRTNHLEREISQIQDERMEAKQALDRSTSAWQTCQTVLDAAKNRFIEIMGKVEQRQASVEVHKTTLSQMIAQCTDVSNRIGMLRDMEKDYEGFSRAVKRVMQCAETGKLSGIHGPVSGLLTVAPRYVTAIETALGAAASHIIVDTPQSGKAAITYLKQTDGGRATFLPLDTIRPAYLNEQGLEACTGFCGIAHTLVSSESIYHDILSNLLARTVIVQDIDAALAMARQYKNRFRIVTLDGQMIQAGGAMTGGTVSKSTGVLARTAQLHALEEQLKQLTATRIQSETALAQAKEELTAVLSDQQTIEAERDQNQEQVLKLQAEMAQYQAQVDSLTSRVESLQLERDHLDEARITYQNKIQTAQQMLETCEQALKALDIEWDKLEKAQTEWNATHAQRTVEIQQLRTAQAENRTEYAAEQRAADNIMHMKAQMDAGLQDSEQAVASFLQQAEQMRQELEQARQMGVHGADDLEHLQQLLVAQTRQRMRIEGERTKTDRAAQDKNEEILSLERENGRLSAQGIQLKNEESQILDKMWESYELTPTPAEQLCVEVSDPAAARQQADTLRAQMRALGNVNLDAVEAYAALTERFNFLREQKDDLETAQRELQKVIDELTIQMKEIFATEFAKLNAYFGQTFTEIFGGGHAELQLADTADILNCGIDIRVCPPGKAVKTLTLLSGGERAFVAIALYFAILKVRPTPFCVLDEIEAALDDVNVTRYAQYLRRLSSATQFIAITHRRGTMEEADMLYGVTMQEQGVSRMLMLNLAEAEQRFQGTID